TSLRWADIKKCEVYYRITSASSTLFERELYIVTKSEGKCKQHISVSLSGKYCRNKSLIEAIKRFGGIDVFDSQSSRSQNRYLIGILLAAIIVIVFVFIISIIREA
ncbi:MAG: hypothetical protein J6J93_06040, partial [Muribaculaceae bacterium]|nr:hypothetical protein [Muribaculaceae bacterium]